MTLKFNPPREVAKYALFVDYGSGKGLFKLFNDLGAAKNSWFFRRFNRYDSKILENVDGEWYTLFEIPKGTNSGRAPWHKQATGRYSWQQGSGNYVAKPMTREEYADFRVKVAREQWENEREHV